MEQQPERKDKLTQEALFKCADDYFKENGKPPTQSYLKNELGGSFSTLGPMLRLWKNQVETTSRAVIEMPNSIRESGLEMVGTWWASIQVIVNEKIDAIQDKSNHIIEAARDEVSEYIEEIKRLELELENKNSEQDLANTEIARMEEVVANTLRANGVLTDTYNRRKAELESLQKTHEALIVENKQSEKVIAEYEKQAALDALKVDNAVKTLADQKATFTSMIEKSDNEYTQQIEALKVATVQNIEALIKSKDTSIATLERNHDKTLLELDKANQMLIAQLKDAIKSLTEENVALKSQVSMKKAPS